MERYEWRRLQSGKCLEVTKKMKCFETTEEQVVNGRSEGRVN